MSAFSRFAAGELSSVPRGIGAVHAAIAGRVFRALGPPAVPVRVIHDLISRGAYEAVRGGLWAGTMAAGAAVPDELLTETPRGVMALAALNGLFGDQLEAEGSALAISMEARRIGEPRMPHIAVFVHGLGETEYAWGRDGYAQRLPGWTPVVVRYNTGRRIAANGASLDDLLARLVREWPVEVERIALIGHSMGGLVARSACARGGEWTQRVTHTVSLGSPYDGAPLEQAVHGLTTALQLAPETRPFARFLGRRSAGIRDLRRGARDPLLPSARHCFVAATITRSETHLAARMLGDVLVLVPSASDVGEVHLLGSAHHLALLNHPQVFDRLKTWLSVVD